MLKRSKRWADLSSRQRGSLGLMAMLQIALLVAALTDLHRRSPSEIHGNKRLWTGIVFINFIGPVAYFAFGRRHGTTPITQA